MGRLIDADKLKEHYAWWNNDEKKVFDDIVDLQPTARKHGHWVGIDDFPHKFFKCDRCGYILETTGKPYNFCPHCGARMDEVEE